MATGSEPHVTYLVLGPLGEEDGPYTIEELRQRLLKGRLRQDDRLRGRRGDSVLTVDQLIPEAHQLAEEGRIQARRLRRTSDERRAAAEEAARAATQRNGTPPPNPVPPEEPAGPQMASPTIGVRPWKLLFLVAGVTILACLVWAFLSARTPPNLELRAVEGDWFPDETALRMSVRSLGAGPAQAHYQQAADQAAKRMRGLVLRLHDRQLRIEQGGSTSTHACTVVGGDASGVGVQISPAHPLLGGEIAFFIDAGQVSVHTRMSELRIPLLAAPER